eukprot:CAMPEP_0119550864 /NCGR_PEP_ID=MMETSP1352-20130426/4300_1 /TAXON_ID=265584 /ORGANISM="Stauroneis constricta, Strain CCMP1120" /LENGTH=145 /DNA_ID=CAMNT_0007596837 /DNA_START=32 /DNA_END=466 /DNA_ORIENTATION=+
MAEAGPAEPSRQAVSSGTVFEQKYGYSRAVKTGSQIFVSGTVAAGPNGIVGTGDAAAQARFALTKIAGTLEQLGSSLNDVVRTRIYVAYRVHALAVARIHGEVFGGIRPCNTLVIASLIEEQYLVEIEADAVVGSALPLPPTTET